MSKLPLPRKAAKSKSGRFAIAILAAGKGTRLKSQHPKVLHEIGGKPLLAHVVAAASPVVPPQNIFAIIGYEAERVREALAATGINFVLQARAARHWTRHHGSARCAAELRTRSWCSPVTCP